MTIRDQMCAGKEAFDSPALAHKVRKRRARRGRPADVYRCAFCGFWHHGNPTPIVRQRAWRAAVMREIEGS